MSPTPPGCPGDLKFDEGRCVSPNPPTCPPKMTPINGACYIEEPPTCGTGFYLDNGQCIHRGAPDCSEEYHFDGINCISDLPPMCEGGELIGQICQGVPECPNGTPPRNGICYDEVPFQCPGDTKLSYDPEGGDSMCCLPPMEFDGKKCHTPGDDENDCPPGSEYDEDDQTCTMPPEDATCPRGYTIRDGKCWYDKPPYCPNGSAFVNDKCIYAGLPLCPSGSTYIDGKCVSTERPRCPPNSNQV